MTAQTSPQLRLRKPAESNRLDPAALGEAMETLLEAMLTSHRRSLAITREHREALSQADRVRMARCASQQAEAAAQIDSLTKQRNSLLVAFRPGVSLREVISTLEPDAAARCEELGRSLKEVVVQVRKEQARLALASSSLAQHMQGLVQQIHRSLSHAGVYSTNGRVEAGKVVVSGLDVTS